MTKTKIKISVSDFALPAPRQGSIDTYSGFNSGQTIGTLIHQEIQQQRAKDNYAYESEVRTVHKFKNGKFIFEVTGKMDGVYHKEKIRIEEIKSAFDLNQLHRTLKKNADNHPFCLQLKTYGYFHWLKKKELPELNLLLVSSRNKKTIDYPIELDVEAYESWLQIRLDELVEEVKLAHKNIKRRQQAARVLSFPFASPRPGQKELIETVTNGMQKDKHLLIQAPTGLGKTIGILFPVLKESMQRGQKAIYLTPKNSQHSVAEDAIAKFQQTGADIKSLTITAKKKICMKEEPLCNAQYCEFAENHYTKVTENKILNKLQKEKQLTSATFKTMAKKYKVCPYELQMDMIPHVETVICDYNYVFSPRASGNKISKMNIGYDEKQNIIIDEAHNLPSRAMDYYSPSLSSTVLKRFHIASEKLPPYFREQVQNLIQQGMIIIESCRLPNKSGPHLNVPPTHLFADHEVLIREFLVLYLESDVTISSNDCVLALFNYWSEFTLALEWVQKDKKEFFSSYLPNPPEIRITCCDASEMLKSCYEEYAQVVGFSATLKPFDFYSQLMGLQSIKLKTEEFVSPFPKEKRKILIIPQISSKYADRQRNYPRIAEVIQKIAALKKGNYFAFFPSFEFLNRVLSLFEPPEGFNVLSQSPGMHQDKINAFLAALKEQNDANIIFAVQGGALSEGVDYPGDLAIGAFVVGTPLPSYDWQREKMKEYYEEHYACGTDYTYTYPAMAKAVQAAGRVIRSETDRGIIVLMDSRFLQPSYAKCMPQDWFDADPKEIVSQSILSEVKQFWLEVEAQS